MSSPRRALCTVRLVISMKTMQISRLRQIIKEEIEGLSSLHAQQQGYTPETTQTQTLINMLQSNMQQIFGRRLPIYSVSGSDPLSQSQASSFRVIVGFDDAKRELVEDLFRELQEDTGLDFTWSSDGDAYVVEFGAMNPLKGKNYARNVPRDPGGTSVW